MMFGHSKEVRAELDRSTGTTVAERLALRPIAGLDAAADRYWQTVGEWSCESPGQLSAWGVAGTRRVRRFPTWQAALEASSPSSVVRFRDHPAEFSCADPLAVAKIARFASERSSFHARNAARRRRVPKWLKAKRKTARQVAGEVES